MRVIKDGTESMEKKEAICPNCNSILEYVEIDIKEQCLARPWESVYARWIECPICKRYIYI